MFVAATLALYAVLAWNSRELLLKGRQDFTIYYTAGKMVNMGLGGHLYGPDAQYRVQQEFADTSATRTPLPYNHPPFEAWFFSLLARLPYFSAYLAWVGTNLLVLIALPVLLRSYTQQLKDVGLFWWVCSALTFFPVFIALLQGQDSVLLLFLLALVFIALREGKEGMAGCCLGLGLFRFHLVLLFVLVFAVQKRGRALLAFCAAAMALCLISVGTVGWHTTISYPAELWRTEQGLQNSSLMLHAMPSIGGALTVIGRTWPRPLLYTVIALSSIPLVVLVLRKWKGPSTGASLDLGFSLCIVVSLLVSYHVLVHDMSLLLLPLWLLLDRCRVQPQTTAFKRVLLIGPMCALYCAPLQLILWFRYRSVGPMAVVLLLWAWGIVLEISRPDLKQTTSEYTVPGPA